MKVTQISRKKYFKKIVLYFSFLYHEETTLNGGNVLGVHYAANKYMIPALEKVCQEFLDTKLESTNVCTVLDQV